MSQTGFTAEKPTGIKQSESGDIDKSAVTVMWPNYIVIYLCDVIPLGLFKQVVCLIEAISRAKSMIACIKCYNQSVGNPVL